MAKKIALIATFLLLSLLNTGCETVSTEESNDNSPVNYTISTLSPTEDQSISLTLTATTSTTYSYELDIVRNSGSGNVIVGSDTDQSLSLEGTYSESKLITLKFDTSSDTFSLLILIKQGNNTLLQKTIEITVQEKSSENNNSPTFTSTSNVSVTENSTTVMTVTAEDADNDTLSYSLRSSDDQSLFTLGPNTGLLSFKTAPNYESPNDSNTDNIYTLTVAVSDGIDSVTQDIAVTVIDDSTENVAPVITNSTAISLTENSKTALTITATDANSSDSLSFSITAGDDKSLFSINSSSGLITFNDRPDYENPHDNNSDNNYTFTVTVSDGNLSDSELITITILDNSNEDLDSDNDGLSDVEEESIYETNPNDNDSDDDSLLDGDEIESYLTDPNDSDSDDDGLSDSAEINTHETDPNDSDSDDDGLSDGDEINTHETDPNDSDSDDDGLSDGNEINTEETNPNDSDSDDDNITDGHEVNTYETDPNDSDSDNDGLTDGQEINTYSTNPKHSDSDSDNLSDYVEVNTHETDPNDSDSDNDTLSDYAEVITHNTDPNDSDSDNDGHSDGDEINSYESNPNSNSSPTPSSNRLINLTTSGNNTQFLLAINVNTETSDADEKAGSIAFKEQLNAFSFKKTITKAPFKKDKHLSLHHHPTNHHTSPSLKVQRISQSSTNQTFYYPDSDSTHTTHSGTLKYTGTYCIIYTATDISVTQSDINSIGNYCDSTIYPNATSLFSEPLDVDSNNKIILFYTDLNSSSTLGFFWTPDLWSDSSIAEYNSNFGTDIAGNKAEILYMNQLFFTDSNTYSSNDNKLTIAHELTHLLASSYQINNNITYPYETWINEGLAEGASEFITGLSLGHFQYLDDDTVADGLGLISWTGSGYNYSLAHTFLEYCRIQCDMEADFYTDIFTSYSATATNYHNYSTIYDIIDDNSSDLFEDFSDVLVSFRIANIVNTSTGKYGYKGEYTPPNISSTNSSNPSLGSGGAVYYFPEPDEFASFDPEDLTHGNNIYYYRVNYILE